MYRDGESCRFFLLITRLDEIFAKVFKGFKKSALKHLSNLLIYAVPRKINFTSYCDSITNIITNLTSPIEH